MELFCFMLPVKISEEYWLVFVYGLCNILKYVGPNHNKKLALVNTF
jgi:hypothetical protein